jgi:serine protease DegS
MIKNQGDGKLPSDTTHGSFYVHILTNSQPFPFNKLVHCRSIIAISLSYFMKNSQLAQFLRFLLQSVALGLAVAFLIVYFYPNLVSSNADSSKPITGAGLSNQGPVSYQHAVSTAAPSVVNVYATTVRKSKTNPILQDPLFRRFFGKPTPKTRREDILGSGVIIGEQGYILTNAHVVKSADEILITLTDGRQGFADIVGLDEDTDLAVLQINLQNLPLIDIGDSHKLAVGDVVLAIGNPYDFGQTVTQGIVSATGRKRLGITAFVDFIQTDADINPGNSGGALVSAMGELVGINTVIISSSGGSQGIGLAIPIHLAIDVMRQIIENGHVVRGWLGVVAQMLPKDTALSAGLTQGGVVIAGIMQGSPADAAGIMPGDVLLEIDNQQLANPQQVINLISQYKPETAINIRVLSGWKEKTLTAIVAQRPSFKKNQ